jgi:hypothetical protein
VAIQRDWSSVVMRLMVRIHRTERHLTVVSVAISVRSRW